MFSLENCPIYHKDQSSKIKCPKCMVKSSSDNISLELSLCIRTKQTQRSGATIYILDITVNILAVELGNIKSELNFLYPLNRLR